MIGFPEGFIPAHPVWYHHHSATGALSNRLATELFKNSVEIPGPQIDALCAAARDADAYVVVGVCEKIPNTFGTMFNSQVYIGPDGTLIGKHQKIMPTVGERLVHTGGFGDTFGAFQTEFGPMSGLICGENSNPLAVFALTAESTRIHVMSWPNHFPTSGDPLRNRVAMDSQAFAQMSKAFVVSACGTVDERMIEMLERRRRGGEIPAQSRLQRRQRHRRAQQPHHRRPDGRRGRHPLCRLRSGDRHPDEARHDFAGHYNRPDIFHLHINRAAPQLYSVHGGDRLPGGQAAKLAMTPGPSALLTSPEIFSDETDGNPGE